MCKTYYVDPQTGRDTNDGLTPEKPLATLFAVNRLALAPGDTVLLKRGSVFEKQFLHLRCCGEKNCPITIAAYGLSLIHISEPTRLRRISYAVFCLKKKK